MTHQVKLAPRAAKELRRLDRAAAHRIVRTLQVLADTPRPPSARQLVGRPGIWRVRSGDYRILYEIEDDALVVLVVRIGHRREIYEH